MSLFLITKRLRYSIAWSFVLFVGMQFAFAEDGTACMERTTEAPFNWARVKNTCAMPITIFYCTTGKELFGQQCDQTGDPLNPYYTNGQNIEAEAAQTFSVNVENFHAAICMGKVPVGAPRFFSSDHSGKYLCPPLDYLNGNISVQEAAASGNTSEQACDAAQSMFRTEDRLRLNCVCKNYNVSQGKTAFVCRALGRSTVQSTALSELKRLSRSTLDADEDAALKECMRKGGPLEKCTYRSGEVAIGIRN